MATGATIMSTTLPTVVGMGVVSRTTDTMFGGKGRRRATIRTRSKGRTIRVYRGARGGHYVMRKGRKVYV